MDDYYRNYHANVHRGSLHPLAAMPTVAAAKRLLPGATFALEGDAKAVAGLQEMVNRLGGSSILINSQHKALYHAAATGRRPGSEARPAR